MARSSKKTRPEAADSAKATKKRGRRSAAENKGNAMRKGRPKANRPAIDFEWIKQRCAELGLSQADLARALRRDSSMITRSLQGSRTFDGNDIAGLASALRVTTDEVHRRLGHPVPATGVTVAGKITSDARVSTVSARKGGKVRPLDIPPLAEAYVAETKGGPLEPYDKAQFIIAPTDPETPAAPDAFGRLCVVEADDHLTPFLGTLGKAATRGQVLLTLFGTGETLTVHRIHRATPVLAIVFT